MQDIAQDRDDLRIRTDIFPSEFTVIYAPVNSDKDLVLGIAEMVPNVLKGNCKISRMGIDCLRKQGRPATSGRQGHHSRQPDEPNCAARRFPTPPTDGSSVGFVESHTPVNTLRKTLLITPEYFERLRRDDGVDKGALNERRQMCSMLKDAHSYDG